MSEKKAPGKRAHAKGRQKSAEGFTDEERAAMRERAQELKGKGADFTMEPTTVRPGVRIAFLRGPEGVLVELIQRG